MPTLKGIDHLHVYVRDRGDAAAWFKSLFGFAPVESLQAWATPTGPLTIGNASGSIHVALFERERPAPSTAIAFAADAKNFLAWKAQLEQRGILDRCADHDLAWSLYFRDPDENLYEITTYEYAAVSRVLVAG